MYPDSPSVFSGLSILFALSVFFEIYVCVWAVGVGGGYLVLLCVGVLFLPEQGHSRPVFPLRSLHTDSV